MFVHIFFKQHQSNEVLKNTTIILIINNNNNNDNNNNNNFHEPSCENRSRVSAGQGNQTNKLNYNVNAEARFESKKVERGRLKSPQPACQHI